MIDNGMTNSYYASQLRIQGLWTQDYKTVAEAIATRALFGTMGIYKIERLWDLCSLNDAQRLPHNKGLV